jgi:hypothetical protein
MDILDDLSCPVCMKTFKTKKGCTSHLRTARTCSWYRRGKLADLKSLEVENEGGDVQIINEEDEWRDPESAGRTEEDPEEVMNEIEEDYHLFDFIPVPSTEDIGEAGPGPSTLAQAAKKLQHRFLDDDDDTRIEDVFEGAGMVIRMNENLHQQWQKLFGHVEDEDGDVEMSGNVEMSGMEGEAEDTPATTSGGNAFYYPFSSELDWHVANWVIKESPGNNAFDRFLAIPGVRSTFNITAIYLLIACYLQVKERLGLSFENTRGLHKIVENIPDRSAKWTTKYLSFPDRPQEKHAIRFRGVTEAIQCLWGDPTLSKDMVYVPKKVFSDSSRENRVYSEMWTGSWWHVIQVCLTSLYH